MINRLNRLLIDAGLVHGVRSRHGWGEYVRSTIRPLLVHPKLRHHREILEEGFSRAEEPLAVFVVGEGKFGKSTLVNALVGSGSEVAKTDFLPLTWHITRYVPEVCGERYEIHYEPTHVEAARLLSFVRRVLADRVRICSAGVIHCGTAAELDSVMEAEDAARRSAKSSSAVWQVVRSVAIPAGVSRQLEIVDSPGISQVRDGSAASDSIEDFYHRADVVLWMVAADKTNSAETREGLTSMARYGKPIIGVVNRSDLIPAAQRERVRDDVSRRYGELFKDVVLVSARDGFLAMRDRDARRFERSGIIELRESIDGLTGQAGRRTKALSLYNTSRQAAMEAASILRQEADTLDANLSCLQKNLDSATRLVSVGVAAAARTIEGESGKITAACAKAMRSSFHAYGEDDDALWDAAKVSFAYQSAVALVVEKINSSLRRELMALQDEIAVRQYRVQSYRGDATVKSHESRTSLSMKTSDLPPLVLPAEFTPSWTMGDVWGDVVDAARAFWDGLWGTEVPPEQRRQRQKERRTRALEAHIRGLADLESQVQVPLSNGALSALAAASQSLKREVSECFVREFGDAALVRQRALDHRVQARAAKVPPAISYTVSRLLSAHGTTAAAS